jgi:hypothetical protein
MFVKLLIAATRVLLGQEPRFVLVGSEDEARAWVKSHRERARAGLTADLRSAQPCRKV